VIPLTAGAAEQKDKILVDIPQLEDIKSVIKESNVQNQNLFYVSITLVAIAIIGTFLSVRYARQQSLALVQETNERLRPWLKVERPVPRQVRTRDGRLINHKRWSETQPHPPDIESIMFGLRISNVGKRTARNIRRVLVRQDEMFDRSVFEETPEQVGNDLPPDYDYYIDFILSSERDDRLDDQNYYVGISISYDIDEQHRTFTGGIFGLRRGGNYIIDSWDE